MNQENLTKVSEDMLSATKNVKEATEVVKTIDPYAALTLGILTAIGHAVVPYFKKSGETSEKQIEVKTIDVE